MFTINSISGGKTSSYMALNYPADLDVFSLVRIEAKYCAPKDLSMIKYVESKINEDFIATAESDKTLYVVRDLEQKIGRNITWVSGETFDSLIRRKKYIPNLMARFCTSELKMKPIFEYLRSNFPNEIPIMNLGIRMDESERVDYDNVFFKHIVGKTKNGRNKWSLTRWRQNNYPLVDNKVFYYNIIKWAKSSGLEFPLDSNCVGCFWKPAQQLRKNFIDEPLKMRWFKEIEKEIGNNWKKEISYSQIEFIPLQLDFDFGTGSGCKSGECSY